MVDCRRYGCVARLLPINVDALDIGETFNMLIGGSRDFYHYLGMQIGSERVIFFIPKWSGTNG